LTDELPITVREFSDWGRWRGLKGKGGLRRNDTDRNTIGLALQQDGHTKTGVATISESPRETQGALARGCGSPLPNLLVARPICHLE